MDPPTTFQNILPAAKHNSEPWSHPKRPAQSENGRAICDDRQWARYRTVEGRTRLGYSAGCMMYQADTFIHSAFCWGRMAVRGQLEGTAMRSNCPCLKMSTTKMDVVVTDEEATGPTPSPSRPSRPQLQKCQGGFFQSNGRFRKVGERRMDWQADGEALWDAEPTHQNG